MENLKKYLWESAKLLVSTFNANELQELVDKANFNEIQEWINAHYTDDVAYHVGYVAYYFVEEDDRSVVSCIEHYVTAHGYSAEYNPPELNPHDIGKLQAYKEIVSHCIQKAPKQMKCSLCGDTGRRPEVSTKPHSVLVRCECGQFNTPEAKAQRVWTLATAIRLYPTECVLGKYTGTQMRTIHTALNDAIKALDTIENETP
jgi:hypothetical protein